MIYQKIFVISQSHPLPATLLIDQEIADYITAWILGTKEAQLTMHSYFLPAPHDVFIVLPSAFPQTPLRRRHRRRGRYTGVCPQMNPQD